MPGELLIDVVGMTKKFKGKTVFDAAAMKVYRGDAVALTGHNGSGKSTFLRLVSGLAALDGGQVKYQGNLRFHYLPEHFPQMNMTARRYLRHIGGLDGLNREECERRCGELFERFFMSEMADLPLKHLSKGTLQKVGVVQALLAPGDVLLLDEPLSGQDEDSQRVFIDLVKERNRDGMTVIMACHERALVEEIAGRVFVIEGHKLVEQDE